MNESTKQMNLAMQEIALANDKFQELKIHLEQSYSHFINSQKNAVNQQESCYQIMSQQTENSYAELTKAIQQLDRAFNDELICRMVYTAINKKQ
ncbi:hypothetical protein ACE1CI_03430 [Aerosakkonemataceae cyanobacterium BLCC-F50]|uniref:Uncharacterized protein n=1 Tax=Floridaenema flaviceps BLCC-F50 TaxID=3153642 RepID=A0ABV4XLW2_9CYAN